MEWQWKAIAKGARWGDLEEFDEDENMDILRRGAKKEAPTLVTFNTTVRSKCKCCSFKPHSNPPTDFTEEQRGYCCAYCQATGGKRHGERCEKRRG
jgi:hypothetical protein